MNTPSKILRAGLLGVLLSGFIVPATLEAKPRISIELGAGPPALRIETYNRPPSRRHVWVPGHWEWSRRAHDWVWRSGAWRVPPRGRGYWIPESYERRGDRWVTIKGRWSNDDKYRREHDRDNDWGRDDRRGRGHGHDNDRHDH